MTPEALTRHLQLPSGMRRDGTLLSLADRLAEPAQAVDPDRLGAAEQVALVKARWLAGEWADIIYGTEGRIDRERAIRELEADSPMGRHLLATEMRAIEMAHEDAMAAPGHGANP